MSIRGRGPHNVIIQPRKRVRIEGRSQLVPYGPPILIPRCSVQSVREWATAEEQLAYGLQLNSLRRVFSKKWAGDVNATIYFDGGEFEVVGDPQFMDQSRRTLHWVTTIRRLGDAVAPIMPVPPPSEEVPDGNG